MPETTVLTDDLLSSLDQMLISADHAPETLAASLEVLRGKRRATANAPYGIRVEIACRITDQDKLRASCAERDVDSSFSPAEIAEFLAEGSIDAAQVDKLVKDDWTMAVDFLLSMAVGNLRSLLRGISADESDDDASVKLTGYLRVDDKTLRQAASALGIGLTGSPEKMVRSLAAAALDWRAAGLTLDRVAATRIF